LIVALVLTSFMSVALLSFGIMMPGPDGQMTGDCPFSAMGASLCPQDTVAVAIHHVSAYYAFLNVPIGSTVTALIAALLFAFYFFSISSIRSQLIRPPRFMRISHDSPTGDPHGGKITHWLSLFENSPSHI